MKQELFNFLETQKIDEDKEKSELVQEIKEHFDEFYKRYPSKNLEKLCTLSDIELFATIIIANNPLKIEKVLEVLIDYPELFPDGDYSALFSFVLEYFNSEYLFDVVNNCMSINFFKAVKGIAELNKFLEERKSILKSDKIFDFFRKHSSSLADLEDIFSDFDPDYYNIGILFLDARFKFMHSGMYDESRRIYESMPRDIKRMSKAVFFQFNKPERDRFIEAINNYFGLISRKVNEFTNEYDKSEKARKKHNKNIDELKRVLNNPNEIKDIDSILKLCPNDKIKNAVLDFINKHNKEIYLELLKEYEKTKQNTDENLSILFTKYNFNYDSYSLKDRETIKEMIFKEIETLLSRLNNLSITNINILNVVPYKLEIVEELLAKGLLNKEWINGNISILYNNKELEQIVSNIDILSKEGINMIQYQNSLDIVKSSLIEENLNILSLYGLSITKTTTNINFLGLSNLREKIELVYSLNLELINLDILNEKVEEILKIKIADSLNIPVACISNDDELLCDFASSIIPKDIKEKLNMDSNNMAPLPSFLENYKINDNVLCINGVYISIIKIKRNLAKLDQNSVDGLFYAIIYNGYYTYEEIEILRCSLIPERNIFNGSRN